MAQKKRTDNSPAKEKENADTQRSRPHRPKAAANSTRRAPLGAANSESDADRIARLEAALEEMKQANDALRAERVQPPPPNEHFVAAADDLIPRPSNASRVKMGDLRMTLGVDDVTWNSIHTCTRDALAAARPDYNRNWKAQKPDKFAKAYNAIEEKFPVLRRCEGQWGIDRIAKQSWSNRKSYRNCVRDPSTYHGRRAAARRDRNSTPTPTPPASPDAEPTSPVAGPSQPRRPTVRRITSPDVDGEDNLMDFDEAPGDVGDDEDDEIDPEDPNGKKRAAPQDGAARKRIRRR